MNKILNYLGIAKKAGYLIAGTDVVTAGLGKKVKLVIVAKDASDATKDKLDKKCYYYHTKLIIDFSTEEIAQAIGTKNPKVIAIIDSGVAKQIMSIYELSIELQMKEVD